VKGILRATIYLESFFGRNRVRIIALLKVPSDPGREIEAIGRAAQW
jgi:hypothetical protein